MMMSTSTPTNMRNPATTPTKATGVTPGVDPSGGGRERGREGGREGGKGEGEGDRVEEEDGERKGTRKKENVIVMYNVHVCTLYVYMYMYLSKHTVLVQIIPEPSDKTVKCIQ